MKQYKVKPDFEDLWNVSQDEIISEDEVILLSIEWNKSFNVLLEQLEELDPEDEIGEPQEWKPEQLRYLEPCYKCKVKPILSYVDAEHCIRDHLPHYVVTCPVCGRSIRSDDPVGTWNIDQYWKSE